MHPSSSTDQPPRRRGRPPDPTLTPRLLDAARDVLATAGLPGLNPDRLARRARTGKAAVRSRWPDMLDLAAEVVHSAELVPDGPPSRSVEAELADLAAGWSAPLSLPERAAATLLGTDRQHPALRAAFARSVDDRLDGLAHRLLAGQGPVDPVRARMVGRVLRAQVVHRLVTGPVPAEDADDVVRRVLRPLLERGATG